jgi:hypothetical protein
VSRVLIARPNDFIVGAISGLLTRLDLTPVPVVTPEALASVPLDEVVGAVVSLAVTSRMPLSFGEVITRLRERAPRLPLIATSLSRALARVQAAIDLELLERSPLVGVPFDPALAGHPLPGAPHAVLVLRALDVEAPTAELEVVLRRHLGLG